MTMQKTCQSFNLWDGNVPWKIDDWGVAELRFSPTTRLRIDVVCNSAALSTRPDKFWHTSQFHDLFFAKAEGCSRSVLLEMFD